MKVALTSILCTSIFSILTANAFHLHAAEETECLREARALPAAIKAIDYRFSRSGIDGTNRMVWEGGRWYRRHSPSDQSPIVEHSFDGSRYETKDSDYYLSSFQFSWLRYPELDVHPIIQPYSWFMESSRDLSLSALADQDRWSDVIRRFEFIGVKMRGQRRCEVYRLVSAQHTFTIWFSIEDHGYPVYITAKQNQNDGQGSLEVKMLITLPGPVVIGTKFVSEGSQMASSRTTTVDRAGLQVNHQPDWSEFSFRPTISKSSEIGHRLTGALRDAKLNNSRCVVVVEEQSILRVSSRHPLDAFFTSSILSKIAREFPSLIEVSITPESIELNPQDGQALLAGRQWPAPQAGSVCLVVLDSDGHELERLESPRADVERLAPQVRDFLDHNSPKQQDAKELWDTAFSLAKSTNRRVWVRTGNNQCAPCLLLTRWLHDNQNVLERDYILLKLDSGDLNGPAIAKRLSEHDHGVPFHAIFDADGMKLVDSANVDGLNIGFPRGNVDELLHLRKMIESTAINLTAEEVSRLIESVNDSH